MTQRRRSRKPTSASKVKVQADAVVKEEDSKKASQTSNKSGVKTTKRQSSNLLSSYSFKDPKLLESLKKLMELKGKMTDDQISEYLKNTRTEFPAEKTDLVALEYKLTGRVAASVEVDDDDFEINDCDGCLGSQREQTLNSLRGLKNPNEIEKFFVMIQYDTERKMRGAIRHLMKGMGYELKAKTKNEALQEFFLVLKGGSKVKDRITSSSVVKQARSRMAV